MEQGNRPWKASWAGESAPLPEISQRSRPTPFRGLSGAYSPAPFCRRVTELTCGDLRSLALTPTLPLSTSSSLRDNSYPTGPSLFTTEGGSVAGKSVCSSGLSPTGFSSLLISAKVCQAEPFCRYLHGLCSFHTGLRTGTVEGQPASYAFWATLSFHTLAENASSGQGGIKQCTPCPLNNHISLCIRWLLKVYRQGMSPFYTLCPKMSTYHVDFCLQNRL